MAVYVDSMRAPFGRMLMCHMIADSTEELLAMADRIGVRKRWIQKAGTPDEHFDIAQTKRAQAIRAGAIAISARELVARLRAKRNADGRFQRDLAIALRRRPPRPADPTLF